LKNEAIFSHFLLAKLIISSMTTTPFLNWPPLIKAVWYDIRQLIPIIVIDMLLQFVISAIYWRKKNIHKWVGTENFEARCNEVNI
jgi:uncharacterized membrane protein (DUF485 family)